MVRVFAVWTMACALATGLLLTSASEAPAGAKSGFTIEGFRTVHNQHRMDRRRPSAVRGQAFQGCRERGCRFAISRRFVQFGRLHDRSSYGHRQKYRGPFVLPELVNRRSALRPVIVQVQLGEGSTVPERATKPQVLRNASLSSFGRNIHGKRRSYPGGGYFYFSP